MRATACPWNPNSAPETLAAYISAIEGVVGRKGKVVGCIIAPEWAPTWLQQRTNGDPQQRTQTAPTWLHGGIRTVFGSS